MPKALLMTRLLRASAATLLVLAAIGLAGCGDPAPGDPTPVKTFKITPAATGSAQTAVPEPSATAAPAGTPSANGGATSLALAGVGSTFDVTELEAPAGLVTIKFDNRDAGVVHNLAVYPGDDASQEPIGATDLEVGPIEQELTLTLEAGAYYYQCDAHPTTMKGTLTVLP